uniref:PX domain-containing protein n=1 Tax=Rhizochromulina marina TaxID=1034831 RepID=A0A7S2WUM7_9STRA
MFSLPAALDPHSTGRGLATRHWTWSSAAQGRRLKLRRIQLRHNIVSGSRYVLVDGREVEGTRGNTSRGDQLLVTFKVDGSAVEVSIDHDRLAFVYNCRVEGDELVEANAIAGDPMAGFSECLALPDTVEFGNARRQVEDGEEFVQYEVTTQTTAGETVTVWRRFSDFIKLHQRLSSSFLGSHLRVNIPDPPSKASGFFTKKFSQDLMQERRLSLRDFLTRWLDVEKVKSNVDTLLFLGLSPTTGRPLHLG